MEKPQIPDGGMGTNLEGEVATFDNKLAGKTSCRALIDIGLLDVDDKHLTPADSDISFVGGSSDMFVLDLKGNKKGYKVGDLLEFRLNYMSVLRILNSKYIDKKIRRVN